MEDIPFASPQGRVWERTAADLPFMSLQNLLQRQLDETSALSSQIVLITRIIIDSEQVNFASNGVGATSSYLQPLSRMGGNPKFF